MEIKISAVFIGNHHFPAGCLPVLFIVPAQTGGTRTLPSNNMQRDISFQKYGYAMYYLIFSILR